MRKFKLISTFAALILMVALMAFGVYAVSSVSVTVSGTITFECIDVYINVTYGIVGGTTYGPYSSQPGNTMTWTGKDKNGDDATFDMNNPLPQLPEMKFTETNDDNDDTMPTCTYFITVENLHGMDIGLSLGYKWVDDVNTTKNNPIKATNRLTTSSSTVAEQDHGTKLEDNASGVVYDAEKYSFIEGTTTTLYVTLTLDNEEYVAGGALQMVLSAAVDINDVQPITFN